MERQHDPVRVVTPAERTSGPMTSGMDRQQAFATEGMWSGFVRTEAGMVSGWHHHGDYETVIYVLTGALRMEFGADGAKTVDAAPGDFLYVPRGAVHRESNPTADPADIVVVRAGSGESTFNVDGPRPAGTCKPGRTAPGRLNRISACPTPRRRRSTSRRRSTT